MSFSNSGGSTGSTKSGFFSRLLRSSRHSEPDRANYVLFNQTEGSITHVAWNNMSRKSPESTRLRTLELLGDVVKKRRLEVTSMEGVYHETHDLLESENGRIPFLRFMCTMTAAQIEQIGACLRHTFFKTIQDLGYDELSVEWLIALTRNGEIIEPFSVQIGPLVAEWLSDLLQQKDHPLSEKVMKLAEGLLKKNSPALTTETLNKIVNVTCKRACVPCDGQIRQCLHLIESVLKFNRIPKGEILSVVTTLCCLVNDRIHSTEANTLMRTVLASRSGYRSMRLLETICLNSKERPENVDEKTRDIIVRGAVFFISSTIWGSNKVETLQVTPTAIIPSLIEAIDTSPMIGREIVLALKKLVCRHGRSLTHVTWTCIIDAAKKAIKVVLNDDAYAEMKVPINQMIDQMEELYKQQTFSGASDSIFQLVEMIGDYRKEDSVCALIDYRTNLIDPVYPDWIQQSKDLVLRYLDPERNSPARQTKAINVLLNVYNRFRVRFETSIVQELILPILGDLPNIRDIKLQYEMLCVLFEVSKTVSMWMEIEKDLFYKVIWIVKRFITDQAKEADNDNLEVAVVNLCECMAERWVSLGMKQFSQMLNIFIDHLCLQYDISTEEPGSDIRARLFSALLSISIVPNSGALVFRNVRAEDAPLVNTNIICTGDEHSTTEFRWTEICKITIVGLQKEKWWPVLSQILDRLARILEYRALVYSSRENLVADLFDAIVGLLARYQGGEIQAVEDLRNDQFARHICPVLSRLLNYATSSKQKQVCEHIVRLVPSQAIEALMACDLCLHMCPEHVSTMASQLLNFLCAFDVRASTAIPLMELLADASMVPQFVNSFDKNDFHRIVDVLVPYSNVNRFNAYIIAFAHRIILRWFTRCPEKHRVDFGRYIMENFDAVKVSQRRDFLVCEEPTMSRQESGDGRQIFNFNESDPNCYDSTMTLTLEAMCATPPLAQSMESIATNDDRGLRMTTAGEQRINIARDVRSVLHSFINHWTLKLQMGSCTDSDDLCYNRMWLDAEFEEKSIDHWVLNNSIITMRVCAAKPTAIIDVQDESFFPSTNNVSAKTSMNSDLPTLEEAAIQLAEGRRRLSSEAVRSRSSTEGRPRLSTMSTIPASFLSDQNEEENLGTPLPARSESGESAALDQPVIEFVQIIVRHVYGKQTYLMRTFENLPSDFQQLSLPSKDVQSLLQHLTNNANACRLPPSMHEQVARSLRNLDRVPEKEYHAVGVLYVGEGQSTEQQILSNRFGSVRYVKFLRLLGKVISLEHCPGGLTPKDGGQFTYENSDAITQTVFLVASLMPTNEHDPQCNNKKRVINNNFVSIVFNESGRPYKLGTVCGQFAHVALEVVPNDETTVVIRVIARPEISCCMAMSRAYLPDKDAVQLLRKMVIRAQLSVNVWQSQKEGGGPPYLSNAVDRLRKISGLREKGERTAVSS
ncbi:hypothetical protein QR680_018959 [Steinernema hermaphroditum]|uniref:Rap-GAP domain-containing protein n=1 Tax=Steinernema hermaphroditum TaxID=289476 RepID=A0AA39LRW8_9BILA|nr:hypothetical protein QR680_018959 [Steinernema hermaphroditum]